jgi:hypothetical protein
MSYSGFSSTSLRKNAIINGNFDIWQRNTTQTLIGYGSDDRWSNDNVGTTKTHSRQAFTLGQTDVPGEPRYYSRTTVVSVAGAGNYELALCQRYYEKSYDLDTVPGTATNVGATVFRGATDNGPNAGGIIYYKVTKRAIPSSFNRWATTGASNSADYIQSAGSGVGAAGLQFSGINSIGVYVTAVTSWAACVSNFQWSADAEL